MRSRSDAIPPADALYLIKKKDAAPHEEAEINLIPSDERVKDTDLYSSELTTKILITTSIVLIAVFAIRFFKNKS